MGLFPFSKNFLAEVRWLQKYNVRSEDKER